MFSKLVGLLFEKMWNNIIRPVVSFIERVVCGLVLVTVNVLNYTSACFLFPVYYIVLGFSYLQVQ